MEKKTTLNAEYLEMALDRILIIRAVTDTMPQTDSVKLIKDSCGWLTRIVTAAYAESEYHLSERLGIDPTEPLPADWINQTFEMVRGATARTKQTPNRKQRRAAQREADQR